MKKLEAENTKAIENPNNKDIEKLLNKMKSYGPISFCSLTLENSSYIQVAGGQFTCMVEFYDSSNSARYRAYTDKSSTNFPDKTKLVFGAGEIELLRDEWLDIDRVKGIFFELMMDESMPKSVSWRRQDLYRS